LLAVVTVKPWQKVYEMIHINFTRVVSFFYFLLTQVSNKSLDAFRVREFGVFGKSEILNTAICSSFDVHSYAKLLYVGLLMIILQDCVFSDYRNHRKGYTYAL
jgi:hypothetical protein